MKLRTIVYYAFILLVMVFSFGCGGDSNDDSEDQGSTAIHITDDITTTTVWSGASTYVVDNGISVDASLTISPGTIIKMSQGSYLEVTSNGAIDAQGTPLAPIVFTSLKDDSFGGDTNGDGDATEPARGDWNRIRTNTNSCTFSYCYFQYGGDYGSYDDSAIVDINSGDASITYCIFAYSKHAGLNVNVEGITLTNCSFYGNVRPLYIDPNNTIDDSNLFHDLLDPNTYNGIWLNDGSVTANVSWTATDAPFVTEGFNITGILTLGAGVTIKIRNGGIWTSDDGVINAIGTELSHITFTSYHDDATGGNTDNAITAPSKGDWGRIGIGSTGNLFIYCDFMYGGAGNYDDTAMVDFNNSTANLNHCTFAHSAHAAVNLVGATDETVFTDNIMYDNTKPLWMSPDFDMDGSNMFHNPDNITEENDQNGIWLQNSQGIYYGRVWSVTEVPFVSQGGFTINEDVTLTLADDVVLKFGSGATLNVFSGATISNMDNAVFTSLKDDTWLGDTNGDGSATSPAASDWAGINYGYGNWAAGGNIYYDTTH